MYYVFAIAKAARHRTTAAALPPTLLPGLPIHHSLAASLSSPFVRLSKFSMFIHPPRRGRGGRRVDVPARHKTRRLSRVPPVRQERGQRPRLRDASIRQTLWGWPAQPRPRARTGEVCVCSARWREIVAGPRNEQLDRVTRTPSNERGRRGDVSGGKWYVLILDGRAIEIWYKNRLG